MNIDVTLRWAANCVNFYRIENQKKLHIALRISQKLYSQFIPNILGRRRRRVNKLIPDILAPLVTKNIPPAHLIPHVLAHTHNTHTCTYTYTYLHLLSPKIFLKLTSFSLTSYHTYLHIHILAPLNQRLWSPKIFHQLTSLYQSFTARCQSWGGERRLWE